MHASTIHQAAIFDLDGTLLDTLADIAASMNHVLNQRGYPIHATNAYKQNIGDGAWKLTERSLPIEARDDQTIQQVLSAFREHYGQNWDHQSKPYPGIPELLEALTDRGVQLAVLSNKPDDFTQACVSSLLSGWDFSAVLGLSPEFPAKPDPRGALSIATRVGLHPSKCCFFGDTNVDMQTALAAGMFGVGVLWGFRDRAELTSSGAKSIISEPVQALQFF